MFLSGLAMRGLSVSRIKVEDFDEQRLNQFGINFEEELNVRLVEPMQILQFADQI